MKRSPQRNEQFENIAKLKASYLAAGEPVISMDTKKKEHLGNFYRPGQLYTTETIETYDHDFPGPRSALRRNYRSVEAQKNAPKSSHPRCL